MEFKIVRDSSDSPLPSLHVSNAKKYIETLSEVSSDIFKD